MLMSPMRDGTTSKDRATQLLICEPLSFAISKHRVYHDSRMLNAKYLNTLGFKDAQCKVSKRMVHYDPFQFNFSSQVAQLLES